MSTIMPQTIQGPTTRSLGQTAPSYQMSVEQREKTLREASQGFEALFLQQVVSTGRMGSLGDDLMGSSAVSQAQSMLDTEMTQSASKSSSMGIADAIYRQFAPIAGVGHNKG